MSFTPGACPRHSHGNRHDLVVGIDWGVGHYETTAEQLLPAAREVVDIAGVRPGERVLDVGCGTGNAALLAASRGAHVTAVDPAVRLLDVARERAAAEGHEIEFHVGEAAALPVPDGAFDVVLSVFAAIFAPEPGAALADMVRALATNGRLVLSAWVPTGPISRMGQVAGEAVRAVVGAATAPPPFPWHDADAVRGLARPLGVSVEAEERTLVFTAESPEAYVDAESVNHPVAVTNRRLLAEHGFDDAAFRARLVDVLREHNEDPAAFRATSRYLVWTMRRVQ
jgi:SAM-dependent methyltransferase